MFHDHLDALSNVVLMQANPTHDAFHGFGAVNMSAPIEY
jgi:hypothetical protein